MTAMTLSMQQNVDANFTGIIRQVMGPNHKTIFSTQMQTIMSNPDTTVHAFSWFRKAVSPQLIIQRRNELARALIHALKNNQWSPTHAHKVVPLVNWLLDLRAGHTSGVYLPLCHSLVETAQAKIAFSPDQQNEWKQRLAPRRVCIPKDIGQESAVTVPKPKLRLCMQHD